MIGIGVVGYGYWGPNLVRNFMGLSDSRVVAVSDLRADRFGELLARYPAIGTTTDFRDLLHDPSIDAIVVATPVSSHYELSMQALRAGKHVLVEKPIASSSEQAMRLIDEAGRRGLTLMVDHTFVYTGAVRRIRELVNDNGLGDLYYYDSVRVNLGLFQHDVNVVWDLAVHDLSIMDYLLTAKPVAVSANGMSHVSGERENIAYLTLLFEGNLIAHIHVNWLAPVKIRRTLIGGSQKMIVYDDIEPSEKVKVYDKGIDLSQNGERAYRLQIGYRTGDMWAPNLDLTEALRTEADHFVRCLMGKQQPITGGEAGLRVVRVLEAASESMAKRGHLVELRPMPVAA